MFKKSWQQKKRVDPENEESRSPFNEEKARSGTMNRAVRLLTIKPHSVAELRAKLVEKDWTTPEIVEEILDKLKDYNYLNDEQFAANFASYNLRMKPIGKRKLQQKLALKKLDKETVESAIEKAFEEIPESDLLDLALEKRLRVRGVPKNREETKKLFDYLLRQGFSFDIVREKVREVGEMTLEEDEIERDY